MKNQDGEKNKMVDELLFGSGDPELSKAIAAIDANYAKGPDENRRARAYTDLKQALAEMAMPLLAYDRLESTPFGDLLIAVSDRGVVALNFGGDEPKFCERLEQEHKAVVQHDARRVAYVMDQLGEYFSGARNKFEIAYDLSGLTPFQRRVLEAVQQVPKGSYVTYLELARRIGKPKAARAVGQALGRNPIPILIPCHRVIATDGSLGGYSGPGGVQTKSELLRLEGAVL
jgi:methylated-DNA-[protein]-cysteine S-methyltransferase